MKKRFMCALTALAMTLCHVPASAADDIYTPAPWAQEFYSELVDAGITSTNSLRPTYMISLGQFCYMMVNLIEREGLRSTLSDVPPMPADYFADITSNNGYTGRYNMLAAAAFGLTEGTIENGKRLADCDNNLTREQAARMMCSLIDAMERFVGTKTSAPGTPKTFIDEDAISSWAADSVDRASALGILQGDDTGRFNPKSPLTVQEAYVMLANAFRQAELVAVERDSGLGITSLKSTLDDKAEYSVRSYNKRYLLTNGGKISILNLRSSDIILESFNANNTSAGLREIPMELERCEAFYESDDAYYLAFGADNAVEDDSKEVYRIVRYDKNWNRQGAASVTGGESHTIQPYRSTSNTAMAEENGKLILHTARLRYKSSDGLNHQSNITITISTPDMKVTSVSSAFPANHVSHSFAQYVVFDNGAPVFADHGDAYPRGFTLNVGDGASRSTEQNFFSFSGAIGENQTNAIPGGLGISADNYLFAGASSAQNGNDSLTYCNAFLAVIPKDGYPNGKPEIKWLTNLPATGNEYVADARLVELNNNTFVVMWQIAKTNPRTPMGDICGFYYAVFDGNGKQIVDTKTVENFIMPVTTPTVSGNRIMWARTETSPYGVFSNSRTRYMKLYGLDIELNSEVAAENASIKITADSDTLTVGETADLSASISPSSADLAVSYTSSDYSVAWVNDGKITARKPGTATITGSVSWRGRTYTDTITITVNAVSPSDTKKPGSESEQNPDSESGKTPGSSSGTTTTPKPSDSLSAAGVNSETEIPPDGRVDYFHQEWDNGNWLELEVIDGNKVRFAGNVAGLADYYNYAVLQVFGEQAEAPLTSGTAFEMEVDVDVDALSELYGGDVNTSTSMIISMLCQNHEPGKKNLGGISFRNNLSITLALNGEGGCTLQVVHRQ